MQRAAGEGATLPAGRAPLAKRPEEADKTYAVSPSKPLLSKVKHNAYTCGDNSRQQLGQPGVAHIAEPVHVAGGPGGWAELSIGGSHAAGLGCDGGLWTWGSNNVGQCGHPEVVSSFQEPVQMSAATGQAKDKTKYKAVACGRHHTVAITDKDVVAFGSNEFGQLGLGPSAARIVWQPTIIPRLQGASVTQVVCGGAHVLCVTAQSKVYAWGANGVGQLGLGDCEHRSAPVLVNALWALPVVQLAAGEQHSVALTTNGHIFAWGCNGCGQLGLLPDSPRVDVMAGGRNGREGSKNRPLETRVRRALPSQQGPSYQARVMAMVEMGVERDLAEMALEETGYVGVEVATEWLFSFDDLLLQQRRSERRAVLGEHTGSASAAHGERLEGAADSSNDEDQFQQQQQQQQEQQQIEGQMGSRHAATVVLTPRRVPLKNVRHISAGSSFTIAVTDEGPFSWGDNCRGALGQGDFQPRMLPCKIDALVGCSIERVSCGARHALFLSRTGAVYGCGACSAGELTQRTLQMGLGKGLPTPVKLALPFGVSHQRVKSLSSPENSDSGVKLIPVIHDVVAGPSISAFITRLPGEEPTTNHISLLSRLEAALEHAASSRRGARSASFDGSWHPPPTNTNPLQSSGDHAPLSSAVHAAVAKGVELVFGSAAAFNAAFGYRDRVGIDVELLDSVQRAILSLFDGDAHSPKKHHTTLTLHCGGTATTTPLSSAQSLNELRQPQATAAAAASGAQSVVDFRQTQPPPASTIAGSRGGGGGFYPPVLPAQLPAASTSTHTATATSSGYYPHVPPVNSPAPAQRQPGSSGEVTVSSIFPPIPGSARVSSSSKAAPNARSDNARSDNARSDNARSDARQTQAHNSMSQRSIVSNLHLFNMAQAMYSSANRLLDDLADHIRLLGSPERAQVLLGAAQNPLLAEQGFAKNLLPKLCATIVTAPCATKQLLVKWWSEYPGALLQERVVRPMLGFLSRELLATKMLNICVMNVIKVLALVEEANQISRALPTEAFYNQLISEKMDVQDHYTAWRQTHMMLATQREMQGIDAPFSFCSYPFLLDARAKSNLMHIEARFQMENTVARARMEAQLFGGACTRKDERVLGTSGGGDITAYAVPAAAGRADASQGDRRMLSGSATTSQPSSASSLRADQSDTLHGQQHDQAGASHDSTSPTGAAQLAGWRANGGLRGLFLHFLRGGSSIRTTSNSGADVVAAGADVVAAADQGRSVGQPPDGFSLPPPSKCHMPGVHSDMCIVRVRRTHLLWDAMEEISRQFKGDLFKPLRVHFIGEEGIDAGGVKKEFFLLLIGELLSPEMGLLGQQEESNTFWFKPCTTLSDDETDRYLLLGVVLGLAVYNRVLLDFPLPLVLYKKLLGSCPQPLGIRDLEDMQPSVARSLRALLKYDADAEGGGVSVEDAFCLSFSVEVVGCSGARQLVELKPGGDGTPVTEGNRHEYVALLVDHILNKSVYPSFSAFSNGFRMLCDGPATRLFNPQELERLVCGNPHLDFNALQQNAKYEGGFSAATPVVQWLWDIVRSVLTMEEKKRFLKFFTGSDRSPIGGLGSLRCVVQRDGTDSGKLPTSHTCFNTLLLPEYASCAKLTSLLKLAIMNSEGFGLE